MQINVSGLDEPKMRIAAPPSVNAAVNPVKTPVVTLESGECRFAIYAGKCPCDEYSDRTTYSIEAVNLATDERAVVADYSTKFEVALQFAELCVRSCVTPVTFLDVAEDNVGE